VKEFDVHHQKYIDEWYTYEQNVVRIFCMHTNRAYRTYLGWYQQATPMKLRQLELSSLDTLLWDR
jgi:hypothetical protein